MKTMANQGLQRIAKAGRSLFTDLTLKLFLDYSLFTNDYSLSLNA